MSKEMIVSRSVVLLVAASLLASRPSQGCASGVVVEALALPRRPDPRRASSGARSNASRRAGAASACRRSHPRFFTSESMLPPLDVTELSAYASSSALNGTDFSACEDPRAEELFTAPYIIPSAHQSSDLGCSTHVCGPLPVVYTNHPKSVERWLCDHLHASASGSGGKKEPCIVGFDVESVPMAPWIASRASHDGPALVQIATPHACLVAQLTRRCASRSTACTALESFMSDPSIIKAGAGIDDDMLELYRFNPRLRAVGRFDLGGVGSTAPGRRVGLARLVRSVLGVEMRKSKKLAMSDWSRCPLDDDRVAYAARDAWAGAAVAHDLAERRPDIFGPRAVAAMLAEERSIEELDDRAQRRRDAKRKVGEIYEQFKEYGDVDGERALKQQMPDLILDEMERLQGIVDETAPDGLIAFDAEDIGLIL